MGIQIWGAFGGFQRKTGALVGRWINGQNVISAVPHPSQEPPSTAQLNQRAKFRLLVLFQSWISPIIRTGFQNAHEEKQSAFNAAFRYNYRYAITGTAPNFVIDYPNFVYSKGRLSGAYNAEVETTVVAELKFNWAASLGTGIGGPTDMATVVVYNPLKDVFATMANAAPRSALTYTLLLPGDFSGDTVQCYISFVSADGKLASDSLFVAATEVL